LHISGVGAREAEADRHCEDTHGPTHRRGPHDH
jgi:hypothetical protein